MDNKELEEYLIEINKTPLLSIEEEIELSKAVQQKGADCDELKKLVKCNERFVLRVLPDNIRTEAFRLKS